MCLDNKGHIIIFKIIRLTDKYMWVQVPLQWKFGKNNTHSLETGYQRIEAGYNKEKVAK